MIIMVIVDFNYSMNNLVPFFTPISTDECLIQYPSLLALHHDTGPTAMKEI